MLMDFMRNDTINVLVRVLYIRKAKPAVATPARDAKIKAGLTMPAEEGGANTFAERVCDLHTRSASS